MKIVLDDKRLDVTAISSARALCVLSSERKVGLSFLHLLNKVNTIYYGFTGCLQRIYLFMFTAIYDLFDRKIMFLMNFEFLPGKTKLKKVFLFDNCKLLY